MQDAVEQGLRLALARLPSSSHNRGKSAPEPGTLALGHGLVRWAGGQRIHRSIRRRGCAPAAARA